MAEQAKERAMAAEGPMPLPVMRRRKGVLHKLVQNRGALAGLILLSGVAVMGIAAPLLAPYDPNNQDLSLRLVPPFQNSAYPLGTDQLGRDIVSRLIFGSRVALMVGISVVLLSGAVGVLLGLVSGYYGGKADDLIVDARAGVAKIKQFIKDKDILRLPTPDRLKIIEMPEFQRGTMLKCDQVRGLFARVHRCHDRERNAP